MEAQPNIRGRGALENPANRFDRLHVAVEADDLQPELDARGEVSVPTEYFRDSTRSVISHNDSPDIPFTSSLPNG